MMMMSLILTFGLLGQERPPARGPEIAKESAARLEFMKKSVAVHTLKPAGDPNVTYRLLAEPAIRFTNSVGTVTDGTIFFWLDADDRPVAAVQVYRINSGGWRQAFSSLSTVPLTAGSVWNPKRLRGRVQAGARSGRARRHARAADAPRCAKYSRDSKPR